jgi:hypothetical protein
MRNLIWQAATKQSGRDRISAAPVTQFAHRERAGKYYIIDVSPGGAAARSGAVKAGDVLHAVDGTAVRGLDQVLLHPCLPAPCYSRCFVMNVRTEDLCDNAVIRIPHKHVGDAFC